MMKLAEKLTHLRWLEGHLRGHNRPLTKSEVARGIRDELHEAISHAYLCQLESGVRGDMSPRTRELIARFFKVHPGYLVDDPSDYQDTLSSNIAPGTDDLKGWLSIHAEELSNDPLVYHVMLRLARHPDPRRYFSVLNRLLELPDEAVERLWTDS